MIEFALGMVCGVVIFWCGMFAHERIGRKTPIITFPRFKKEQGPAFETDPYEEALRPAMKGINTVE